MTYEDIEKSRNRSLIFAGVFILIPIIGIVCCLFAKHLFAALACFILLIAGAICAWFFYKRACNDYRNRRKDIFVRSVLTDIFQSPDYSPMDGVSRNLIRCADMIPMGKKFLGSNLISGWRNGLRFEHSDLIVAERDVDVATPVFSGAWTTVDFDKSFKTTLYVVEKDFPCPRYLGTRMLTDNGRFNSKFRIYSQNEEKMKGILTPYLMQRMMEIVDREQGDFAFGFVGPILHIGVNNGCSILGAYDKVGTDIESAKSEMIRKARVITDIVDSIDMNTACI